MLKFPPEFSDLLNSSGKEMLAEGFAAKRRPASGPFFELHERVIDPAAAGACSQLLDRHIHPLLRVLSDPIPRETITAMKENYTELLPKAVSVKTCFLSSRRFRAYATAEKIGLIAMMHSETLHRLAEAATGLRLRRPTAQVICYEAGDYTGPHTDHHPENENTKDGFIDLHVMFGNDAVDHQFLVYERKGHLNQIRNVNLQGGIAVYRLPFWHYTTPLVAKPGREKDARRWLLLSTFEIAG